MLRTMCASMWEETHGAHTMRIVHDVNGRTNTIAHSVVFFSFAPFLTNDDEYSNVGKCFFEGSIYYLNG